MPKALAVAFLLSACTVATARGFFSPNSDPDSTWWYAAEVASGFQRDSTEAARLQHGQRLDSLLATVLNESEQPLVAFSQRVPTGVLRTVSTDEKLVVYTFAIPLDQGGYHYKGWVHARLGKKTTLTALTDSAPLDPFSTSSDAAWSGGLVYKVLAYPYRRTTRYVGLHFRPHRTQAQVKWIEPWILGRPRTHPTGGLDPLPLYFGAGIFDVKEFAGLRFPQPPKRLLLSFAPEVSASIRLAPNGKDLLVDEVAPLRHATTGDFRHYGPTLAVDRLVFDHGKWRVQPVENP